MKMMLVPTQIITINILNSEVHINLIIINIINHRQQVTNLLTLHEKRQGQANPYRKYQLLVILFNIKIAVITALETWDWLSSSSQ